MTQDFFPVIFRPGQRLKVHQPQSQLCRKRIKCFLKEKNMNCSFSISTQQIESKLSRLGFGITGAAKRFILKTTVSADGVGGDFFLRNPPSTKRHPDTAT